MKFAFLLALLLSTAVIATPICGIYNDKCTEHSDESTEYRIEANTEKITDMSIGIIRYNGRCVDKIFEITERTDLLSYDNNEAKYEYGDVGLTIFDLDSFNDHYECVPAITETNTYYSLLDLNCTQSGVPAFNGYRSLIGSTKEVEMVLTTTGDLHVNSVAYYKISEEGCPANPESGSNLIWIILGSCLIVILLALCVFYVIKSRSKKQSTAGNAESQKLLEKSGESEQPRV